MRRCQQLISAGLFLSLLGARPLAIRAQQEPVEGEWRYFGGDRAYTRYSPLDQINRHNVGNLRILWRRPAVDPRLVEMFPGLREFAYLKSTPIMVDGVLYAPNALGLVEAFDPGTGETLWRQELFAPRLQLVSSGESTRGVDYWTDGSEQRLFVVRGEYLYALDPKTGTPHRDFGDRGRASLHWNKPLAGTFTWSNGPIVVGDVVVIAGNTGNVTGGGFEWAGDAGAPKKEATPEDVRGYDVRSGRLLWTFHVVPQRGEFGVDTWGNDSWKYSGDLGSWCCPTADEELGYVYIPTSAPTANAYGGHRPGDNLFANSLVALDAKTGQRVWHFQMVHHDLWDYDTVGPATLGDITVNGRQIKAVMQPSKTGFLYVFDRVTGEPVWPIEERPVPQSTVPGEYTSPTQPFPTKPPPFDRQGLTEDDLIDFTPALRARTLEFVKSFVLGPIFMPPTLWSDEPGGKKGTLMMPGAWGAGSWNTGAFDPETGMYYAVSRTNTFARGLAKPSDPEATIAYVDLIAVSRLQGLPIIKPPWGRITAIDLNRGEQVWMVANGDGPRNHRLLKGLDLPPLGIPGRPTPLVTKTLLFIGEGSDAIYGVTAGMLGKKFRAYDKATGQVLGEIELPAGTTGGPMTYLFNGKQYIVVAIGGWDHPSEWVALGLR